MVSKQSENQPPAIDNEWSHHVSTKTNAIRKIQRTLQLAMRPTVEPMLAKGNHPAKPHHRMRQALRVAKHKVEDPAKEE